MSRLQRKIEEWRSLPEEARLRKAHRLTWGLGIAMLGLWGTVLLPFQLYVQGTGESEPAVQGVQIEQEASQPTPLISSVPAPTIELQK